VSLRGRPVEQSATLPDGREVVVRVGVPDDPYIAKRDLDTVAVDLVAGDDILATVNSVLEPEQTGEARSLAREIVTGLESGELEPTAGALETLADRIPPVREAP
jgi:hypothetical protein